MTDNVHELDIVTRLDIPAERVLRRAIKAEIDKVVVLGWDQNGEAYFASSIADGAEVLWLLELCKKQLLEIGSGDDDP